MEEIQPAAWTDQDRALWGRIAAHDFEPAGAALTFAGRLARDHGWSLGSARAAIDEYRRFCFLAVRAGFEVTPSEEVDEVWHQHLTYSRDYWQVWCRAVLKRDLHHGPTRGGTAEGRRFTEQYADTLASYEAWFGPPPEALWPGTAERFGRPRFRIVDRASHLAVPVPRAALTRAWRAVRRLGLGCVLALLSGRPASAASLGVLDWTAEPFLTLYVLLACLALAAAFTLPPLFQRKAAPTPTRSRFTPAELGLLAGGASRAADVLVLEDIAARRVEAKAEARGWRVLPVQTDVLTAGGQRVTRAALVAEKADEVARLKSRLADEGFLQSAAEAWKSRGAVFALTGPVVLLGAAKIVVGLERDRPVGILFLLVAVTVLAALVIAGHRSATSQAGRDLIQAYKAGHARALRAPRAEEVIGAFALAGAAALAGTAFESYGRLMKGDGSGCGGDGGCGGGGCGGCGG